MFFGTVIREPEYRSFSPLIYPIQKAITGKEISNDEKRPKTEESEKTKTLIFQCFSGFGGKMHDRFQEGLGCLHDIGQIYSKKTSDWKEITEMKYGYIRVSTTAQAAHGYSLEEQREAVIAAGVDPVHVIEDAGVSGKNLERPGIDTLSLALHPGDTVVVASLDRLGRSLADISTLIQSWTKSGINLVALRDGIDTATITGRTMAGMMAVIAETERQLILERTAKGRAAAAASGKPMSRPKKWDDKQAKKAAKMRRAGASAKEIANMFGVNKSTVYNMLKRAVELGEQVPNDNGRTWDDSDAKRVLDMRNEGMTYKTIAKKMGKSTQTIYTMAEHAQRGEE